MTSVLYDAPGPVARRRSRVISVVVAVVVVVVVGYSLFTLGGQGLFDADRWDIFRDPLVWLDLLKALGVTLLAALYGAAGAILLGILLSLLRSSPRRLVRAPTTGVLELLRGMPVLLMMVFFWGVVGLDPFLAVVVALALYNGAIIGEALRSGMQALPRGQREAGLSLGLGGLRTRLLIEFPQAFRHMLPIIVAQLVVLLKDTSLGYIIGMQELLRRGRLTSEFFGAGQYAFSVFVVMVAMYLAVNLTVSWLARRLSRGAGEGRRRPGRRRPPGAPLLRGMSVRGSVATGDRAG